MMIKAYGDYQNMAEKAYDSDGATLANQEKYAESLKGKITELGAIWEKIGDDAVSSSWLKGLTDIGIAVSNLIDKFSLLNSASVIGSGILGAKGLGLTNYVTTS